MNNVTKLLPKLTVNAGFINELVSAETPCFAPGLVEERNRERGFLALRPAETIPKEKTQGGFAFGYALIEYPDFEIIQFAFNFYGFKIYNILLNPNNHIVQKVITTMVESEDYFFFAINPNNSVTTFRSEFREENFLGIKDDLKKIQNSQTTEEQYQEALSIYKMMMAPNEILVNWTCRDNIEYLDPANNPLELNRVKSYKGTKCDIKIKKNTR